MLQLAKRQQKIPGVHYPRLHPAIDTETHVEHITISRTWQLATVKWKAYSLGLWGLGAHLGTAPTTSTTRV